MLKKVLAFDYGKARIGIASGQTLTNTASPLTTIRSINGEPNWIEIKKIIDKWRPNEIIVGLPLDMNEEETESTKIAKAFGEKMQDVFNIPVSFVDEKLSTREARWRLETGTQKSARHIKVDAIAACVILETWMGQNH
jgi:putative Holliday junction resolvase